MSIIYDALNKTQEIIGQSTQQNVKRPAHRLWFFLGICIVLSLLIIIAVLFHSLYHPKKVPLAITGPVAQQITKRYLLSGIFLSDAHQVAIINHGHYHIGDHVDGMKIIAMSANHVKLQDKHRTVILSMIQ